MSDTSKDDFGMSDGVRKLEYAALVRHGYPGTYEDFLNRRGFAAVHEPAPIGDGQVILDLVRRDFEDRARAGAVKYGMLLRANNGRDALMDAYQEAVDLCMYLRQAMYERDGR